jgi:hypothetical protein
MPARNGRGRAAQVSTKFLTAISTKEKASEMPAFCFDHLSFNSGDA